MTDRKLRVDLAADMRRRAGMAATAEKPEPEPKPADPDLTPEKRLRVAVSEQQRLAVEHPAPVGLRVDLAAEMRKRAARGREDDKAGLRIDLAQQMGALAGGVA